MTLDPPFFREIGGQFENKALKAHKPKKKYRVMLSKRHQEMRKEKPRSAQYVKASMISRSAQQFWNKLLRIEVRPFTRNIFVMVV